ncbi:MULTISPECIES: putative cell wall binding protein [unclassified Clostridium]|uniref:putative cell wall binding protein n=1 Tax=unclassified Clostridium TaxID=2614128 RepID=UPI00029839BF|nr:MULTISPECIES: putative cell wall binding protein [unclassified Clostridium]EKQ57891.1 MAG: putative cell wall binding protein [Clostridium sp. Maddingley MBC34-26]
MIKKLKKLTAGIITIAAIFSLNPIAAHAEWRQNPTGWWYANGDSWYTGWKQIDGKWYYFKKDGYMAHNCFISNKYHLNSYGVWDSTIQGFTIQLPSNWIKTTDSADRTYYKIDDVGTSVDELISILQGKSQKDCMDELTNNLKSMAGVDNLTVSNKTFNGKSAQVVDYKHNNSTLNKVFQIHQVIFFNNNESYIFTIVAANEISSENMNAFNNFLNTIKY